MEIKKWLEVGPDIVEGVVHVVFDDKNPHGWIDPYHWYDWESGAEIDLDDAKYPEIFEHEDVPRPIWQCLDGGFQTYDKHDGRFLERYIFYYSRQEALDALSRAAIKWAKKEKYEKLQKLDSQCELR
jgi:hypothetical protein